MRVITRPLPVARAARLVLVVLPAIGASACSHAFWVAGHNQDYSEIYSGTGTSNHQTSEFQVTFEPSGDRCTATGQFISAVPDEWRNTFICDNGRTAEFEITRNGDPTLWHGEGAFSDGARFVHIESNDRSEIDPELANWRRLAGRPVSGQADAATASRQSRAEIDDTLRRGTAAEEHGQLAEALAIYVEGLEKHVTRLESVPDIVDRAIDVAIRMRPSPAMPESATKHAAAAENAIRTARRNADLTIARREYANALSQAPWWPDGWFNLAKLDEQIGTAANVRRDLVWYLRTAPDAPDRDAIQKKIGALP